MQEWGRRCRLSATWSATIEIGQSQRAGSVILGVWGILGGAHHRVLGVNIGIHSDWRLLCPTLYFPGNREQLGPTHFESFESLCGAQVTARADFNGGNAC